MQAGSFHEIELEAWSQRADRYDDLFAGISTQAIAPILDGLGDLRDKRFLDVACGTGHLVAAATRRGARSEGIDFAAPMVDAARRNYPAECYGVADAMQLPFETGAFDALACAFGLSHMACPQQAVAEAYRVLKPGGRFAFTLWFGPDDGGELLGIVRDSVGVHASASPQLPDSWTQLRFAGEQACAAIVLEAGFNAPVFLRLPIKAHFADAREWLDLHSRLSVRTNMLLESQPPSARRLIEERILSELEARRRADGTIPLGWPALLTLAEKPS
jgi:SAM-dependent methyltransferase